MEIYACVGRFVFLHEKNCLASFPLLFGRFLVKACCGLWMFDCSLLFSQVVFSRNSVSVCKKPFLVKRETLDIRVPCQ